MVGDVCMSNEEEKYENCYEFDELVWVNHQFIKFVKKDDYIELQINLEGIESFSKNICKLSRTRKNRILYLGNADWGNGKFVCYTPFWYLDVGSIRTIFLKLSGNEEILRAEYTESENCELNEIYFEGTRKGLEKLIKILCDTKETNQQITIDNVNDNKAKLHLNIVLVNCIGRTH